MITWVALAIAATWASPDRSDAQTPPSAPPADTSPSRSSAQSEAGEPRAKTSADPAPSSEPAASPGSEPGAEPPAADARPQSRSRATKAAKGNATGKADAGKAAVDKLQLQTATVTGEREQPKVMYIVPWKRSDIGDLSGKPMNSLLDEALAPVDRDEFKREVVYYQAVRADASQNGAAASGAASAPAPPR
jgi:hypothetical protein